MKLNIRERVGRAAAGYLQAIDAELDQVKLLIGNQSARQLALHNYESLQEAEFKVFSQFGEDGIIQYLIRHVPLTERTFIEFGVQDYSEANTRFLLMNNNWSGLIIDGDDAHLRFCDARGLKWRYDLTTVKAFVTPGNVDRLFEEAGFQGDIGLLSLDIDGVDYWVLASIKSVQPRILICEYNSTFGPDEAVTIPEDQGFERSSGHYSNLYWGASLSALVELTGTLGYSFVGSNSAGNNAFFVRDDVLGNLRRLTARDGFVRSRFRESRALDGSLSLVRAHRDRLAIIRDCVLVDLRDGREKTVSEIYGV